MNALYGIVLAGVHTWEHADFERLLPRPMMPVGDRPLICHVLDWLHAAGLRRAGVCANSSSRLVRRALADGALLGMDLDYFEDWTPRGPAGCIRDAAADRGAQRLVVTEASIIPTCDLGAVLAAHARSGAALTVVAAPEPAGRGEEWIPAGIYVLEHDVLAHIPDTGYQDLKEKLLPRLHERGVPTAMYRLAAPCPRLRDAASYLALNAWALGRLLRSPARPGFGRVAHGLVHGSARVAAGARLVGPVLVGPGCQVAAGATLLGPVVLGAGTAIAAGAVVSRSVLWNNCRVGRNAVVDQSVCGDGASVEAEASLRRTVGRPAAPGAARGREAGWPHRLRGWLARRGRAAAALDPQRGLEPALAAR